MPLDAPFAEYLKAFHSVRDNTIPNRAAKIILRIRGPDLQSCAIHLRSSIGEMTCAARRLSRALGTVTGTGQVCLPIGGEDG